MLDFGLTIESGRPLSCAETEHQATEERAENERAIALDNQRERALQEYIDKISELVLEKHLRESKVEEEVRTLARVRTLTALRGLDSPRKGSVLQFLHEAGLICVDQPIIPLKGADLSEADLKGVDLSEANLVGVCLRNAT